ncbi:MAG TPA: ABC transporter substrate-binding protein, partial [Thermomicrobiales bacterium]|nr:ABC transporter substrate-binding protein [Thermomicrobiales bacterium]
DFTQSTLSINPAAKWNDGTPFTADDVVFSMGLYKANPNFSNASYYNGVVKSVTAKDATTVVFELTSAQPRFHYNYYAGIIEDNLRIVPKHIWEKEDANTFTFNPPVYTGPYTLKESSSSKLYYLWQKNPDYWNKATIDPAPNYVAYVQQTAMDAAVQAFTAGNVDVTSADYPNQQVIASSYKDQTSYEFPDPCPRGIWFNAESPSGLFKTAEGRWALSYLLDRETIAKTIWQPETVAATYPWANYPGWTKWAPDSVMGKFDLTFNPQKAEEMLDALGAKKNGDKRQLNGKDLSLTIITPVLTSQPEYQIAASFAQALQKVGIGADVKSLPGSAFGDSFQLGEFDITSHWICGMQFDPDQLFTNFNSKYYVANGTRQTFGQDASNIRFKSPALDKLINEMDAVNPDDPKNMQLFLDGLTQFETDLPCVPTIQTIYAMMYNTKYWTNWPDDTKPTTIPANWWGQFLLTIANLKATGAS